MESKDAGQTPRRIGAEAQSEPDGCKRRMSYGVFPKPLSGAVPYANSREELAGISLGEKVRLVMATTAWNDILRPVLAQMDEDRPRRGPAPAYTSEELESCLLYQRLAGASTYGAARARLAGDRGEADRIALGFDRSRKRVGAGLRLVRSLDGVPSEVTVWRHKQRFGVAEHVATYRVLFERLVREHFEEFPDEMREEARLVHWDGSMLLTHYTSFERRKRRRDGTKEVKPPTLVEGGFMKRTETNAGKDGHGFCLVAGVTQTGLPLMARLTPIDNKEAEHATAMLESEWPGVVGRFLRDDDSEPDDSESNDPVRVMACDAAYSGSKMRQAVHSVGYVPNCHPVSHADRESSQKNAEEHDEARYKVMLADDKHGRRRSDLWHLNGHWELFCACGQRKTMRRATTGPNGEAIARLEGSCPNCGHVSLTAGEWRIENKPYLQKRGVRKALDGEESDVRWAIGNPLTFHDRVSARYGSARFGHNEGFHGALVTRFGLLKEKSWHRHRKHAECDLLQVFCLMHAIAKEQRRRSAGGVPVKSKSGPPPPLALAA